MIDLGKTGDGRPLGFHLPTLIESRMLVQANSGAGKSWTIRRLLEQSHGHVQQIVLDLEGEFSTLREKFDYIVVGKDGDTPADPLSAKLLAKRLLELQVSAICDLYELKAAERIRFVRFFLESLMMARRELWHPVLVIVDPARMTKLAADPRFTGATPTGGGGGGGGDTNEGPVIVLVSSVTAAVCAKTLPSIVAPVVAVIDA